MKVIMDRRKIHDWETHGQSNDIDENTPVEKVKGPNVFERAKEEIEAIVEAIHTKKSSSDLEPQERKQEEEVVDQQVHKHKTHHKETHGTSNDIDLNTPIDEVKAPSVFERAKEEIEAIVEAIHHKRESEK